jgi:type IV pilus assembly protein PilE
MSNRPPTRPGHRRGFTLIELVVAILIIAILGTIALSAYTAQTRKSRRTEAKTALLDLAGREERNFSTTNTYSQDAGALGYAPVLGTLFPVTVGSGYYRISVVVPDPAQPIPGPGQPATYAITATPLGDQLKDTPCTSFSLNQLGVQTATGSATATVDCWR